MIVKKKTATPTKHAAAIHLELSLIENSRAFLNQSLRHYRKTGKNVHEWPFAMLHLTQSLELMLKQRLEKIHPIFIYENIDHPRHTVSLEQALLRMEALGIAVDEKEKLNIRKAADIRNRVVHYEVELNRFEWKKIYSQIFEFVHFFHRKHLRSEIHTHLAQENWPIEARLMLFFSKNFVTYNGVQMPKSYPKEIVAAQRIHYFLNARGRKYARIKYGDELGWLRLDPNFADIPCHDCYVIKGQYHADNCDVEECPIGHHQLLGCGCW